MSDQKRAFEARGINPMRWFSRGESFIDAARTIERRYFDAYEQLVTGKAQDLNPDEFTNLVIAIETFRPAQLLRGYACELMLKAFLIAKKLPEQPHNFGHELRRLADYLFFDLSDAECYMLKLFEREILWAGRYPRPKREEDFTYLLEDEPSEKRISLIESSNRFYDRLKSLIEDELDFRVVL